MLLTAMARLQLRHPAEQLACQTFGSPPVLAHRDGGGSADVLKVMLLWPATVSAVTVVLQLPGRPCTTPGCTRCSP